MSEESVSKKFEAYKEGVKENFTILLEKTFPEKILELDELLKSDKLSIKRLETIHTPIAVQPLLPPGAGSDCAGATSGVTTSGVSELTNKFMQWNFLHLVLPPEGRVKHNEQIEELLQMVNKLQFELLQHTAAMKIAITYLVPKVEDGNNFGVEIQEETVKMIKDIESSMNSQWKDFSGGFSGYYKDRASFVRDLCKDPHVDDSRQGLRQLDERAFLFFINVVTFIRDAYGKIHDVIIKNIEKIKKPRTSNAGNLF